MKLLTIVIMLFSSVVHATEGFYETAPKGLEKAWDSTLMIYFSKDDKAPGGFGSGSVIFKKSTEGSVYLGILTAGHVIADLDGMKVRFFKTAKFKGLSITNSDLSGEIKIQGIERLIQASGSDLGLAIIKVAPNEAVKFNALPLSKSNASDEEKVYLVGFPYLEKRVPIEAPLREKEYNQKRWSQGYATRQRDLSMYVPGILRAITADSSEGNSGGPALNKRGEIIGVYSCQGYYGSANEDIPRSWIVEAEQVKQFAEESLKYLN